MGQADPMPLSPRREVSDLRSQAERSLPPLPRCGASDLGRTAPPDASRRRGPAPAGPAGGSRSSITPEASSSAVTVPYGEEAADIQRLRDRRTPRRDPPAGVRDRPTAGDSLHRSATRGKTVYGIGARSRRGRGSGDARSLAGRRGTRAAPGISPTSERPGQDRWGHPQFATLHRRVKLRRESVAR
jgi:hypothetical protein